MVRHFTGDSAYCSARDVASRTILFTISSFLAAVALSHPAPAIPTLLSRVKFSDHGKPRLLKRAHTAFLW